MKSAESVQQRQHQAFAEGAVNVDHVLQVVAVGRGREKTFDASRVFGLQSGK